MQNEDGVQDEDTRDAAPLDDPYAETEKATGAHHAPFDLFIIGGGVNGCGIARDAAGRGLTVALAEAGDLAGATSSASTKLLHGGLRYLEYFELRLVRESLAEREVLLRSMPHIAHPMRFILPLDPDMRFDTATPASRVLGLVMPWLKGRRPSWLIRAGLWAYDHMGKREILQGTTTLDLKRTPEGVGLDRRLTRAFEFSDVWVDDARLVVLNAKDAARQGAEIMVRSRVQHAARDGKLWRIEMSDGRVFHARGLVNAAGPWVSKVLSSVLGRNDPRTVRLVRGSHIVTHRLFDHDKAYFLQGKDGRIVFMIPYERDFTMIGTTEAAHEGDARGAKPSAEEIDYLIDFANQYLDTPISPADIVHRFAGVRPLIEDGGGNATAASRDYTLELDAEGPPLLSVFGGKITTYRKLAEAALGQLAPYLTMSAPWTEETPLPGGYTPGRKAAQVRGLMESMPFLTRAEALRLVTLYGRDAADIFIDVVGPTDMGRHFSHGVTEAELRYLVREEFARTAEDILWRRTKLGLVMTPQEQQEIADWLRENLAEVLG